MDEDEVYETEPAGRKFHWAMPIIRILMFVANLFGVTGRLFTGIAEDMVDHVNYKIERDAFAAEAGRELEMLVEGPEEN